MELYDVMRTTFAAREFTDDPLPDTTLFRILENARFAPSGGNRQGWYVIIVRDRATREALAALTAPAARRYVAQQQAGESPWNSINPTQVDETTMARTSAPARLTEPVLRAAVVLVVCVDLQVVASTDQYLGSRRSHQRRLDLSLGVEYSAGCTARRLWRDADHIGRGRGTQDPGTPGPASPRGRVRRDAAW